MTGLTDLTFSPFILQWRAQRLGPVSLMQRVVFDFDLPTGEYKRKALSLSAHAFAANPYYAVTLFPAKRLETSWRVHYLWNATNHSPNPSYQANSTQAGQAIHFNATLGIKVKNRLWMGPNGYFLEQITRPKLDGRELSNSPERVGAIGAGTVIDMSHWIFYANAYHEIGALNRPQGNRLVLRVQWIPGRKTAQ